MHKVNAINSAVLLRARQFMGLDNRVQYLGLVPNNIRSTPPSVHYWTKPPHGTLKLNIDRAFVSNGRAGGGVIFRDHDGFVTKAFMNSYATTSALHAELLSLLDGLRLCIRLGWNEVIIETDCSGVVKCVSDGRGAWRLIHLIDHIRSLMQECRASIHLIPREINSAADSLAKDGVSASIFTTLDPHELPSSVSGIVELERSSLPYIRF